MATLYLMGLEDRVDLARNRIDRVILKLRSVQDKSENVQQAVSLATAELEDISALIGR
jgi:hypothetical protein